MDVIKGGADAKALIALAILFPTYPFIGSFPMIALPTDLWRYMFPFALLIMFNAAILVIVVPAVMFFYNLAKRDLKFPAMLFGYRMGVEEAKHRFVWPMEYFEDGVKRMTLFPRDSEHSDAQLDGLTAAGVGEIWVTPKIPFLIPIAASLILSTIVGNLLLLIIR